MTLACKDSLHISCSQPNWRLRFGFPFNSSVTRWHWLAGSYLYTDPCTAIRSSRVWPSRLQQSRKIKADINSNVNALL